MGTLQLGDDWEDGGYGDADLEEGAADRVEVGSDAGYSDCSDVIRDDKTSADIETSTAAGPPSPMFVCESPIKVQAAIEIPSSPANWREPGDAAQSFEPAPRKRFRCKSIVNKPALRSVDRAWRNDMQRWAKFIRTSMDDQRSSLGPQLSAMNIVSPFCGNLSECFASLVPWLKQVW